MKSEIEKYEEQMTKALSARGRGKHVRALHHASVARQIAYRQLSIPRGDLKALIAWNRRHREALELEEQILGN